MSEHPVQIDGLLYVGNADKADSTPWSSHADCYVKRCAIAYAFRNAFGASVSHLDDFLDGFGILAGTHKVGCPKFLTKFEPCFVVPDQNDAGSSEKFCREYGTESYRTVADDSHSFSRLHSSANRRVVPGSHYIGQRQQSSQEPIIVRSLFRDPDQGAVRKRRANRFGLTAEIVSAPETAADAAGEKPFAAKFTTSIAESKRCQHAITFFDGPYVPSNLLYDSHPFVTGSEARFPVRFFAAIEP